VMRAGSAAVAVAVGVGPVAAQLGNSHAEIKVVTRTMRWVIRMTLSLIVVIESYTAFGIADTSSRLRGNMSWSGESNPTNACIDKWRR
jgi:hypothetical protein